MASLPFDLKCPQFETTLNWLAKKDNMGVSIVMGDPQHGLVFVNGKIWENPTKIRMMTRGTPMTQETSI